MNEVCLRKSLIIVQKSKEALMKLKLEIRASNGCT